MGTFFNVVGSMIQMSKMERMSKGGNAAGLIGLLDDIDGNLRWQVVDRLVKIGPRAVQPLVQALSHPATPVRAWAAVALRELGDGKAVPGLSKSLLDPEVWVRRNAARALGHMSDPAAAAALVDALGDAETEVTTAAREALAKIGTPGIGALRAALRHHDDTVRWQAVLALAEMANPLTLEPLIEALGDGHAAVRGQAAAGLKQLADRRALPALVQALADSDAKVRQKAAEAIGALRLTRDDASILGGLLPGCDPSVRATVADKLLKLDWRPSEEQVRLLGARYWAVRGRWEQCLVIGAPATEALGAVLKSSPSLKCVETIAAIGGEDAVAPLIDCLVDRLNHAPHPSSRDYAQWDELVACCRRALGGMGASAVKAVMDAAPRIGSSDKSDLLRTLASFTTPQAVKSLLEIVEAEGPGMCPAIVSLGRIGDGRAVMPLVNLIRSGRPPKYPDPVTAAVGALGLLGDARAVGPLIALLRRYVREHVDDRLCRGVIEALGRMGDHRACGPVADYVFAHFGDLVVPPEIQDDWSADYPWRFDREALAGLFDEHHAAVMIDLAGFRRRIILSPGYLEAEAAYDRQPDDEKGFGMSAPEPEYEYDYSRNFAALRLLCEEETPVSSNLLRRVAAHGASPELKEIAKEELARRGNPAEDPGAW